MENEKKNTGGEHRPKKHRPNHKKSYFIEPADAAKKNEASEVKSAPSAPKTPDEAKNGGEIKKNHNGHYRNNHKRHHGKPKGQQNNGEAVEKAEKIEKTEKNTAPQQTHQEPRENTSEEKNTSSQAQTQSQAQRNRNRNKNHRDRKPYNSPKELSLSLSDTPAENKKPESTEEPEVSIENLTLEEILGETPKSLDNNSVSDDTPMIDVVGIRFKSSGKIYYFDPAGKKYHAGKHAIVETARGQEYGEIVFGNKMVKESDTVPPLRPVLRTATEADIRHHAENKEKEDAAFKVCNEKIIAHGLDMKLIDVQYTFDNTKLLFYFTSSGRVDFRELVKDLASVFRTRIELRQIGIRDEAKMMGGLGPCGRSLCCSIFLTDFGQVSIKMAKEQNLSLNSTKISGVCGRLMCCLRYEYETYEQEIRLTPPVDSVVKTADGIGVVTETTPLAGTIKVRLNDSPDVAPKVYHRDDVTVLQRKQPPKDDNSDKQDK